MHVQLSGRVLIVTGASRGIGRAVTCSLVARGAVVVASARDDAALAALRQETGATVVTADVRDPAYASLLVSTALERHGRLDGIVANAGVGYEGTFASMPLDRVDEILDVNVRAPIGLAHAALPSLVAGGGAVVFVSSIAGALPVPLEGVYSASKSAIEAFAETLREELRGSGVHVGTVLPGPVRTEFFERRGTPYTRGFPRLIPPDAVAAVVVRLIEDERDRVVVPRWLALPLRMRGTVPGVYRALARRFG